MPSKALLASAAAFRTLKSAAEFGLSTGKIGFDFSKIVDRKNWIVSQIEGPGLKRYFDMQGIRIIEGKASFKSANEVDVDGNTVSFEKAVIASGSEPLVPPFDGLEGVGYITSDQAINLREVPESIIMVGGSAVGLEFTNVYESFDSQVTIVEETDRIAFREDKEISQALHNYIAGRGVSIFTGAKVLKVFRDGLSKAMTIGTPNGELTLKASEIFIAMGRRPVISGLNLEGIDIKAGKNGIEVNKHLQTSVDNIYAAGDVIPGPMLAQAAAYEGDLAAKNALGDEKAGVDYGSIPRATWSNPIVASVGLTEDEAIEKGINYAVTKFPFAGLARAFTSGERIGFVKVIADLDNDQVVGFHVIGHHADEIIHEGIIAVQAKLKVAELATIIHVEITMAEGAGNAFFDLQESIEHRKRKAA